MTIEDLNLIFVDVEATGATPFSGKMTQFGAVHYASRQSFHGVLYESVPDPDNPAKPVIVEGGTEHNPSLVLGQFRRWLAQWEGRPILVSDNNGYDAMWIAYFFDSWGLPNPFGHSSRRISDFYAGLVGDFSQTQYWKKWRVTPHTHHPVDDAMGNVEAFATMLHRFTP